VLWFCRTKDRDQVKRFLAPVEDEVSRAGRNKGDTPWMNGKEISLSFWCENPYSTLTLQAVIQFSRVGMPMQFAQTSGLYAHRVHGNIPEIRDISPGSSSVRTSCKEVWRGLFQSILERHMVLNFLRSFQTLNIFLSIHILRSVYISMKNGSRLA